MLMKKGNLVQKEIVVLRKISRFFFESMKMKLALPEWGCSCNIESVRNIDFADCKETSRSGLS
jgi:hypothetical protein